MAPVGGSDRILKAVDTLESIVVADVPFGWTTG